MKKKYTTTDRENIISLHAEGKSVKELRNEFRLPKSTIYYWIKKYSKIKRPSGEVSPATQIYLLEKHIKRLEVELAIWKKSGCSINSPISQKLEAIMSLHELYGVHAACETLGVRRSTFYHYQHRRPEKTLIQREDEELKPNVQAIFDRYKGRIGSKKIRIKLIELGFKVSIKRVTRLMKELGLVCVSSGNAPKQYNNGSCKYYRNRLKQNFIQTEPNKVWVSDITYLYVNYVTYYLCVIIDLEGVFNKNKQVDVKEYEYEK